MTPEIETTTDAKVQTPIEDDNLAMVLWTGVENAWVFGLPGSI